MGTYVPNSMKYCCGDKQDIKGDVKAVVFNGQSNRVTILFKI